MPNFKKLPENPLQYNYYYSDLFGYLADEFDFLETAIEYASTRLDSTHVSNRIIDTKTNQSTIKNEYTWQLKNKRTDIKHKLEQTNKKGTILPLQQLSDRFNLDAFEQQVLIICLAVYINPRYFETISLLDNITEQGFLTQEQILFLIIDDETSRPKMFFYFSESSNLKKWCLVENVNSRSPYSGAKTVVRINVRIAEYLLGSSLPDTTLNTFCKIEYGKVSLTDLYLSENTKKTFDQLLLNIKRNLTDDNYRQGMSFYLYGPSGSGRKTFAMTLCRELGIPILVVDTERIIYDDKDIHLIVRLILREAILQLSGILITGIDSLFANEDKSTVLFRRLLLDDVSGINLPVFLIGKGKLNYLEKTNYDIIPFELTHPADSDHLKLWKIALEQNGIQLSTDSVSLISSRVKFTVGQIHSIAKTVSLEIQNTTDESISLDSILRRCAEIQGSGLPQFATSINSPFEWNDLVLPRLQKDMLKDICTFMQQRNKVLHEWGFHKKLSSGRGVSVLFTGPSGTGKTMAAGILAKALKLEIYKIDLSMIVSKYIGETEKNLSVVFREAQASGTILFFDEADAIFGKRSNVRDAHDRYANIEVAYLLQKMEDYEGMTILATNLRQNIDDAFTRRIRFVVEFPIPDRIAREKLWKNTFPQAVPIDKEIDYKFLARHFNITGANIKNIALIAALKAAESDKTITMSTLLDSIKQEYKKNGNFVSNTQWEQYAKGIKCK